MSSGGPDSDMNPDRWQRIEELFNAAAALPEGARADFLEEACGGDEALREEVVSLLEESEGQDSFLSRANVTAGLSLIAEADSAPLEDQRVGKYLVRGRLGRGGMGDVYLAEDPQLGRLVAVKLLPTYLTGDPETVLRFQQEARAASGVSHPNVAHVYEIGVAGERHYIVMEYVKGVTLRQLLRHESLSVGEALEVALQVAHALAAAHAAGVVHRDVKPENIMVGGDGHAKVVDFGLAKLTESRGEAGGRGPSSGSSVDTQPGMIMGTTAYMSPEQVRGRDVDSRTDLWGLGVVLYEMLARRKPFAGETPSDVAADILRTEPAPLPADEERPAELERIVRKALSKEKEARYQTAEEFARDLKRVKQQLDFSEHVRSGLVTSLPPATPEREDTSSQATAPGERPADAVRATRRLVRPWALLAGALAFLLFAAALLVAYRKWARLDAVPRASTHPVARITNSGAAVRSAISPDGNLIAYVLEEGGQQGLYLRRVGAGTADVPLVPPAANEYVGVSFTPDGRYVYFGYKNADDVIATLYRLPPGGGEPQKVLTDVDSAPGFSPDGARFVFLRIAGDGNHEDLCLADADGRGERVIYTRSMPEYISHQAQPSFSPDGQVVAFAAAEYVGGERKSHLLGLRVADGTVTQIAKGDWAEVSQTAWAGAGAVIMTARANESQEVRQLWRVSYPSGEARQLTDDFNDYAGVSLAADGATLVTQAGTRKVSLWSVTAGAAHEDAHQLTFGNDDGYGVAVAPDGRIFYGSNAGGNPDIWSMSRDGGERRQLTTDAGADADPAVSPDGRTVAFTSTRGGGNRHVWLMDADGARQRQMAYGVGESTPAFSPDGRYVFYYSYGAGLGSLWRVPVEGGEAAVVAKGSPRFPAASPDGRWLATAYRREGETANKIAVVPLDAPSSAAPEVFDPVAGARSPGPVRWERDGRTFTYIVTRRGVSNIWRQPLDRSPARQVTNFADGRIYAFDWSPDGRSIICARGDALSSVLLFRLD